MNWWMEKPYRMVQNNLRDIDGAMAEERKYRIRVDGVLVEVSREVYPG